LEQSYFQCSINNDGEKTVPLIMTQIYTPAPISSRHVSDKKLVSLHFYQVMTTVLQKVLFTKVSD